MKRFLIYLWIGVFYTLGLNAFCADSMNGFDVQLEKPGLRETVRGLSCEFTWQMLNDIQVKACEMEVKSGKKTFKELLPVNAEGTQQIVLTLPDTSYSGVYSWKITAIDDGGNYYYSPVQRFFWLPEIQTDERVFSRFFPYALELQSNKYFKTNEYYDLVDNIQPKGQLECYSTLGFVYRQAGLLYPGLNLQEIFQLMTNIGIGCKLKAGYEVWDNRYFLMEPSGQAKFAWYSKGIQKYSNEYVDLRYGVHWHINPGRFITLKTMMIPKYQFHYFNHENELRTLTGSGWSFALECVFSKSIMNAFEIGGIRIDPLRIPLELCYSYIKDSYTGKHIKLRQLKVTYLLR